MEEVSLDNLDLDILKEVGITDEEIKDFNKKNLKKKDKQIKKEKKYNDMIKEKVAKLDDELFSFDENNNELLDLEYDEF
ncbi:MAG: hypothetical protein LBD88_04670 [Candidatus Peribacteria bacterium]|nr:hypothetical protein [Candidatus Peribacteria bacterium]